jgi:glutaredoxin-related protein
VFHVVIKINTFGPTSLPLSIIGFTVRTVQMITSEATSTQNCLEVLQELSLLKQKLGSFVSLNVLTALFIATRKIGY